MKNYWEKVEKGEQDIRNIPPTIFIDKYHRITSNGEIVKLIPSKKYSDKYAKMVECVEKFRYLPIYQDAINGEYVVLIVVGKNVEYYSVTKMYEKCYKKKMEQLKAKPISKLIPNKYLYKLTPITQNENWFNIPNYENLQIDKRNGAIRFVYNNKQCILNLYMDTENRVKTLFIDSKGFSNWLDVQDLYVSTFNAMIDFKIEFEEENNKTTNSNNVFEVDLPF